MTASTQQGRELLAALAEATRLANSGGGYPEKLAEDRAIFAVRSFAAEHLAALLDIADAAHELLADLDHYDDDYQAQEPLRHALAALEPPNTA